MATTTLGITQDATLSRTKPLHNLVDRGEGVLELPTRLVLPLKRMWQLNLEMHSNAEYYYLFATN